MKQTIHNWSQIGAWQGGTVSAVVLSPNFANDGIALAATSAGLFRSETFGRQWALTTDGFSDPSALALAVGQGSAGTMLLASTEQGRLFRSHDLGATWAEIESWGGLGIGSALAVSPAYAHDKTFFVATPEGVFRTLDDGITWQEASFGLLDLNVIALAIAPDFAHSQSLWCGTALGGLFRTRNAGRAWRESGEGLPDSAVQSLVLSPLFAQDQTLFTAMEAGGIYRSQDGGRSWMLAGELLAEVGVNALTTVQDPSSASYSLLAGTSAGIYASNNLGASWELQSSELPIFDLALASNGAGLAALYQHGILARSTVADSWQPSAQDLIAHAPPQVVRSRAGVLLALDNDGEMALSSNKGADWQALQSPDPYEPIVAIAAATVAEEACFYGASLHSLFCTPEQPVEWHELLQPPLGDDDSILQMIVSDWDERLLIALGTAQGNLWWLDDEVREWHQLHAPWQGSAELLTLFFVENERGAILHTLTAQANAQENYDLELWRFEDDWVSMASFESEVPVVLTLASGQSLLLATQHRLIRFYTHAPSGELDVAQHFFAEESRISALAKGANAGEIYLATTDAIHRSSDDGATWQELKPLPTKQAVVSLLLDGDPSTLAVITLGGQVWHAVL